MQCRVSVQWERLLTSEVHSRQSSQEWQSQQIHPKVRQYNAQRNCNNTRSIKIHNDIVGKRLNKFGLFGRGCQEIQYTLLSKKTTSAQLEFEATRLQEQCPLNRPEWRCLPTTHSTTSGKNQTAFQHKHLVLAVEHSGGGVMVWTCLAATVLGHLAARGVNHELLCRQKYFWVKREAICPTATAIESQSVISFHRLLLHSGSAFVKQLMTA